MGEGSDECGSGPAHGPWAWSAYRAYNELLRDKIRKQFDAQEGPWMDQLAKLLVELVNARWEGGRKGERDEAEIVEKLDKLLSE